MKKWYQYIFQAKQRCFVLMCMFKFWFLPEKNIILFNIIFLFKWSVLTLSTPFLFPLYIHLTLQVSEVIYLKKKVLIRWDLVDALKIFNFPIWKFWEIQEGRERVKISYLLFHSWKYRFSEREQASARNEC